MSDADATTAHAPKRRPGRALAVWILLVLASLLLLLSTFAVWVDRVALNTDTFVDTSTELIEDEAIRQAVASRAVDELFESVDVEAELEGQLPEDFQNLSGPAAAGLREASYTIVARALEQPRLQQLWARTLEESHRTLVAVLEGDGERVSTEEGTVALDLETLVLEAAERVGIRKQIEDNLPEDVGRIEILRSDELDVAQDGFQLLKTLAWILPLLTIILFAIAVWLARDRRRLVRRIGIALVLVSALGLIAVNVGGNYVVDNLVSETDARAAASNAWDILTELLGQSYRWLIAVGVLFLVAAWLAGPGPRAVSARRFLAPAVRDRVWAYAGLAVLGLFLLLVSPVGDSTRLLSLLFLVALGAVWIEVTRQQTRSEFPDASGADVLTEARTRLTGWWEAARTRMADRRPAAPPTTGSDLTATLTTLADLHARGELTDEEYAAAKARVLAGE